MKQFFKFLFASCLGVFLAMGVLFLVGSWMATRAVSSASAAKPVKPNTILHLTFDKAVPEKTNNTQRAMTSLKEEDIVGLHDMVAAIGEAKSDNNIKGIYIDAMSIQMGMATATVLRDALLDFKESGKFIIAHSKYYTQGAYYMASTADKVYVHPMGSIDFRGFSSEKAFFKDMIDKLGIKMQIFWAGQFKSASEPYRLNKMSEPSRLQVREYLEGIYQVFLTKLAASRNVSVSELRNIADNYLVRNAKDAVKYKLADQIAYKDEVLVDLRNRIGLGENDKIKTISISKYYKGHLPKQDFAVKDKIAIVYAEGIINLGKGTNGTIGDDKYTKIIRKLRKKDDIKAIVLRVNSGGGSALASENIWRELELAKEEGKVVVTSMGDVAASGGYYISCNSQKIFAEPNTITGSIGVVGAIPSLEKMMGEHAGIHFDTVKTGRFTSGISPFLDMSDEELRILQAGTEDVYQTFLSRVAAGRKMSVEDVHKIAQGRVWIGSKAKELGLVDEMGGLDDALAAAASLAGLEKYRTTEYPRIKEPLQQFIEDYLGGNKDPSMAIQKELGEFYPYYKYLKEIKENKGIQAIIPYTFEFK
ncbi:MAG TPA: signal peptide peptidase SppA [Saprospiraceae bacterium]|nr:signal peptide peptidase SppA [Saprospiraceae bacterium]